MPQNVRKLAIGAGVALLLLTLLPALPPAAAGEYPRRIAIAPFVNLTGQDEIKPVVAVLPRLLSTRLMALAGAETFLLPPGGKSPDEAAKEAKAPLLLQGTVSKLGKGYSIDTTVTDVSAGTSAGAFFVGAATEDEIIPQVGTLAADMAEKLFGVKSARPQPPPAPAAASAVPAPAPAAPAPAAAPAAVAATAPRAAASAPPAPAEAPSGPWDPRKITRVAMSDKIVGEIYRVAVGDVDGDGQPEIVATGGRSVWFFKIKGNEVVPFPPNRIERGLADHLLNVEIFDADGDGKAEIFVTDLVNERLRSFVLKYRNNTFEVAVSDIPYYIAVLSDVDGKPALVGQSAGLEDIFSRTVSILGYANGKVTAGKSLGPSLEAGVFGLNALAVGKEGKYVYVDADEHLRLWDAKGKTLSKTKEYFARGVDHVTKGQIPRNQVSPMQTWIRGRVLPVGGETGSPVLLTRQAEGATMMKELRNFSDSRVVAGRFDGSSFVVKAASDRVDHLITDAYPYPANAGPATIVAASVVESLSTALSSAASRVYLYRIE